MDHMFFQANDDIREYDPWVATTAAQGKHRLCYSNKRRREASKAHLVFAHHK